MDSATESAVRRARLVAALRTITPEMRTCLSTLKAEGEQLRSRPDLIWHLLLGSFATMGNSRGHAGLFGNPELVSLSLFNAVVSVPPSSRKQYLEEIFRRAKVRMPSRKAEWLVANIDMILAKGGLESVRQYALGLVGRDAKLAFMKSFRGFGDKYGRNVWMVQYDPDFRDTVAVDERIKRVTKELGYSFRTYAEHEAFYRQIAADAGLEAWEVDRLLYWYRDHFLNSIAR